MNDARSIRSNGIIGHELRSRRIAACYYQPSTRLLALKMTTGKWRIYPNVDETIFNILVLSEFPGHLYEKDLKHSLPPRLGMLNWRAWLFIRAIRKTKNN